MSRVIGDAIRAGLQARRDEQADLLRAFARPAAPDQAGTAQPSRTELLDQLAHARAAGDRIAISGLLGRLVLTPSDTPPGGGENADG